MFSNLTSRSNKTVRNLKEAVEFLRANERTFGILPEYVKVIRFMHVQIKGVSLLFDDSKIHFLYIPAAVFFLVLFLFLLDKKKKRRPEFSKIHISETKDHLQKKRKHPNGL